MKPTKRSQITYDPNQREAKSTINQVHLFNVEFKLNKTAYLHIIKLSVARVVIIKLSCSVSVVWAVLPAIQAEPVHHLDTCSTVHRS